MCYHTLCGYSAIATPVSRTRLIAQRQGSSVSPFSEYGSIFVNLHPYLTRSSQGANVRSAMQILMKALATSKSNGPSKIRGDRTIPHPCTCVPRVLKNRRTRERSSGAVNSSNIFRQTEVNIECEPEYKRSSCHKNVSSVGNSF